MLDLSFTMVPLCDAEEEGGGEAGLARSYLVEVVEFYSTRMLLQPFHAVLQSERERSRSTTPRDSMSPVRDREEDSLDQRRRDLLLWCRKIVMSQFKALEQYRLIQYRIVEPYLLLIGAGAPCSSSLLPDCLREDWGSALSSSSSRRTRDPSIIASSESSRSPSREQRSPDRSTPTLPSLAVIDEYYYGMLQQLLKQKMAMDVSDAEAKRLFDAVRDTFREAALAVGLHVLRLVQLFNRCTPDRESIVVWPPEDKRLQELWDSYTKKKKTKKDEPEGDDPGSAALQSAARLHKLFFLPRKDVARGTHTYIRQLYQLDAQLLLITDGVLDTNSTPLLPSQQCNSGDCRAAIGSSPTLSHRETRLVLKALAVARKDIYEKKRELVRGYDAMISRLEQEVEYPPALKGAALRMLYQLRACVDRTLPRERIHMLYWRLAKYGERLLLDAHVQTVADGKPNLAKLVTGLLLHRIQHVENQRIVLQMEEHARHDGDEYDKTVRHFHWGECCFLPAACENVLGADLMCVEISVLREWIGDDEEYGAADFTNNWARRVSFDVYHPTDDGGEGLGPGGTRGSDLSFSLGFTCLATPEECGRRGGSAPCPSQSSNGTHSPSSRETRECADVEALRLRFYDEDRRRFVADNTSLSLSDLMRRRAIILFSSQVQTGAADREREQGGMMGLTPRPVGSGYPVFLMQTLQNGVTRVCPPTVGSATTESRSSSSIRRLSLLVSNKNGLESKEAALRMENDLTQLDDFWPLWPAVVDLVRFLNPSNHRGLLGPRRVAHDADGVSPRIDCALDELYQCYGAEEEVALSTGVPPKRLALMRRAKSPPGTITASSGRGCSDRELVMILEAHRVMSVAVAVKRAALEEIYTSVLTRLEWSILRRLREETIRRAIDFVKKLLPLLPSLDEKNIHMLYWRCCKYGIRVLTCAHLTANSEHTAEDIQYLQETVILEGLNAGMRMHPGFRVRGEGPNGEISPFDKYILLRRDDTCLFSSSASSSSSNSKEAAPSASTVAGLAAAQFLLLSKTALQNKVLNEGVSSPASPPSSSKQQPTTPKWILSIRDYCQNGKMYRIPLSSFEKKEVLLLGSTLVTPAAPAGSSHTRRIMSAAKKNSTTSSSSSRRRRSLYSTSSAAGLGGGGEEEGDEYKLLESHFLYMADNILSPSVSTIRSSKDLLLATDGGGVMQVGKRRDPFLLRVLATHIIPQESNGRRTRRVGDMRVEEEGLRRVDSEDGGGLTDVGEIVNDLIKFLDVRKSHLL